MRKLASIQRINEIKSIPNADNIVMARVLGYECVVKIQDFKLNDLGVYFEVDSLLPEKPEFEFLRDVKFRIKARKFRKQVSMGLFMPLSILPKGDYKEGDDVTEILEVKNYEKMREDAQELTETNTINKHSNSRIVKALLKYSLFRKIYLKINVKHPKSNWPSWISRTDEERIQGTPSILMNNLGKSFYIGEKLDGQSKTAFSYFKKKYKFFNTKQFGVCSRNIWLKTDNNSSYWYVFKKYNIKDILMKYYDEDIVIQGEVCGPGIQKNKYNLTDYELFVFNIIRNGVQVGVNEMVFFCNTNGLKHVPILNEHFIANFENKTQNEIIDIMIEMSKGKSVINPKIEREGIVVRLNENPRISFKVINPNFLIANDEK